jgi:L-histidine N-alpha-methyltransferase
VLRVLNRQLGADFAVEAFSHVAVWDAENEWIEMHLRADRAMSVLVPEIGLDVQFAEGEELSTEVSAKFRREGIEAELDKAGFSLGAWWTDSQDRFALSLWRAGSS